ncbi:Stk1 family PASTA domain-containing Ser/Thr kinase [Ornithinibacillus californiensis]|uniref:Stk1 family PASTA domain-containing Ser/Thr kinase n=1 Tax=Ornithinibacillus californiensis TaxID=161536 RepID=UPI00064DED68|nr:Stk1 family PASTA domain-containing Ser/Thr kinase [Ornithinibacillus californiensis]
MLNGHLLSDRYQIREKIGGGGMADVYLAKDIILDRSVAIKVLRLEYANDEEFIARFDREAQSATSLSHPNVVTIYDVGEEEQILYMVMEYVDGMTLKEFIQRYGPIDVPEAIEIMKQITAAIAHAHENGIVHRDIKPQNILIDTYGHVKVTDFGIAVALSATSLTQTNSILGSVHYLSPEQARGGMATKKSDIYSLGIVFFEMLTGRLPFSGQSPVSIALKHLQSETPSVRRFSPDVPQSVENIVLKATAKDPFHRFNTVYEMEDTLEIALSPEKLDEPKYTAPTEVGEETKAIPIITENQLQNIHQDTIVHQANAETKKVGNNGQVPPSNLNNKKKKNKKLLITSIILFLLLTGTLIAAFVVPSLTKPKDVTIPEIIDSEYEDAKEELELLNLKVERKDEPHEEIEEGKVIKTNPRPGRTVKEGHTVTVYVSEGKKKQEFDDYTGRQFRDAERLLNEKGFLNIRTEEVFSDRPVGEIVRQIRPEPNTEVVPSETSVLFEISKGKEPVEVGNVVGSTVDEAKAYLEAKGLIMVVHEEHSDTEPEGRIIRQDPQPSETLNEDDTVNVYVSLGREEPPFITRAVPLFIEYTADDTEQSGTENGEENPESEPIPQEIKIYVQDMVNSDITVVQTQFNIYEDTERTIEVVIERNSEARIIVWRDDEKIEDQIIPYKEEGE